MMRTRTITLFALFLTPFLCMAQPHPGHHGEPRPAPWGKRRPPEHERQARFEAMLKEFPPEMQSRLEAAKEDPRAFRREVNRCFYELRRREFDSMMALRNAYLNAKTEEEKNAALQKIRETVSERLKRLDAAAERRIQENEKRIEEAKAQLDALKKMHAERVAQSEETVERIVRQFTDPDAAPTFPEFRERPPRRGPGPDGDRMPPPPDGGADEPTE